jgi:hypothetical protein
MGSPRFSKPTYATLAHHIADVDLDLEKRSLMSGTSMENLMRALKTYQTNVGPG